MERWGKGLKKAGDRSKPSPATSFLYILLEFKDDRERVVNRDDFAFVFTGCPLRHGLDDTQGFGIELRVHASEDFEIAQVSVCVHDKLDDYPSLNTFFLSFFRIFDILCNIAENPFHSSGEFGHIFDCCISFSLLEDEWSRFLSDTRQRIHLIDRYEGGGEGQGDEIFCPADAFCLLFVHHDNSIFE